MSDIQTMQLTVDINYYDIPSGRVYGITRPDGGMYEFVTVKRHEAQDTRKTSDLWFMTYGAIVEPFEHKENAIKAAENTMRLFITRALRRDAKNT